jgi:nucleoside-diphosphate-sugar epimerase
VAPHVNLEPEDSVVSRVLITGASGFIGSRVTDALIGAGHEVSAVSARGLLREDGAQWLTGDLLDARTANELMGRVRPELLVHLAWMAEPGAFWTSPENVRWVEATLRLVRAFAEHGGTRAVLAGTCAEYQWGSGNGVCVERSTPLEPQTLYGVSKNATRAVCEAFADQAGFELCWGRIFFLYGPDEPAARLVPSVTRALLEGDQVPVSAGAQVRDFLHVDDVADAFVALLESDARGAVNLGSGHGVSVREVVETIGEATGRPELIQFGALPPREDEPQTLIADVRRLREDVGFEPQISLEDGVAATVQWWREQSSRVPHADV